MMVSFVCEKQRSGLRKIWRGKDKANRRLVQIVANDFALQRNLYAGNETTPPLFLLFLYSF
jgi:hypothetical protein